MRSLVFAVLAVFFVLSGCKDGSSDSPNPNLYLLSCYSDVEGTVFVDIDLPPGYYGVLTEATSPSLGQIATVSATYNLGVMVPGTYVFELELILREVPEEALDINLDGLVESCTLTLEGEDPGPGPEPCPPAVIVNVNDESGVLFRIDGCGFEECSPEFALSIAGKVFEFFGLEAFLLPLDLEPGEYPFEIKGTCDFGSIEGVVVISGEQEPDCDDEVLPPKWRKHKILVCYKGRNKLVPYWKACKLIRDGKATLGECREED